MRTCVLIPVYIDNPANFVWRWRATDHRSESKRCFEFFYPCVEDALRAGFAIDMAATLEHARKPVQLSHEEFQSVYPEPTEALDAPTALGAAAH